jgi:hypothetical protein
VTLPLDGSGLLISAPEGRDDALLAIASRLDQLTRYSSG